VATKLSPYRQAENEYRGRPDDFWDYLESHRLEDPSLAVGWAVKRAERLYNLDQQQIAERTAVTDRDGNVTIPAISKSFVSAMLTGRSNVSPEVYVRLASACEVNELEFYVAEGWTSAAAIAAYQIPERELVLPILHRISALPRSEQPSARAVVISVLDSIKAGVERIKK
jgi:transcriptional regulator with XRE-family HTH domain